MEYPEVASQDRAARVNAAKRVRRLRARGLVSAQQLAHVLRIVTKLLVGRGTASASDKKGPDPRLPETKQGRGASAPVFSVPSWSTLATAKNYGQPLPVRLRQALYSGYPSPEVVNKQRTFAREIDACRAICQAPESAHAPLEEAAMLYLDALDAAISAEIEPNAIHVDRTRQFPRINVEGLATVGFLGLVSVTKLGGAGGPWKWCSRARSSTR